jgi:hypothetical protein
MQKLEFLQTVTDASVSNFMDRSPAAIQQYMDAWKRVKALDLSHSTAEQVPAELLKEFDTLHQQVWEFVDAIIDMKTFISLRIPEIKEEDNMGVNVQWTVIKDLNRIEEVLTGGSNGGGGGAPWARSEIKGAAARAPLYAKGDYLESRFHAEKKFFGKKDKKKEGEEASAAEEHKAPSAALLVAQVDREWADKIVWQYKSMIQLRTQLYTAAKQNMKKITDPRGHKDSHASYM